MSLANKTIAVLGAGNMAEALVKGVLGAKLVSPNQVVATDPLPARCEYFERQFRVRTTSDNAAAVGGADIVLLAVKPQMMSPVLAAIRDALAARHLVISIAAGVPTARIERELGGSPRVVRVMPNTPALVGVGAAALCRGRHATEADLTTAEGLLGAVGITVRVAESMMDAVTALSGSGPAYVFYLAEAMIQAGIDAGLPAEVARRLAIQTVHGAGQLLATSTDAPAELRRKVTSPGGTTEAAIRLMAAQGLPATINQAIQAATRRGRELAGG